MTTPAKKTTIDLDHLRQWIGRSVETKDTLDQRQIRLAASILLDYGERIGPMRHLFYFNEAKPLAELGRDGHPARGGFLPPVPLPRRMWAGGRLDFHQPLRIGDTVRKTASVADVAAKEGRSGPLCFVTTRAEFTVGGRLSLVEERDLVYRNDPDPTAPQPAPLSAPQNPAFSREVQPSSMLLFRYSALTFNGHRIHYDLDYCREVEGYPHLVVHGPLLATLLADLSVEHGDGAPLTAFSYRAASPLFADRAFFVEGRPSDDGLELWARADDGRLAMSARAVFATSRGE